MTETGKGNRWEGDRQGRSEPAFQVPAPRYSLHQLALHGERPANICGCCFAARPVSAGSSAAVLQGLCRSDRPPAVFACSGLAQQAVCACHLCHAIPTAPVHQPRSVLICPHSPVHFHVRRDPRKATVCKLQELSRWQLQRGSAVAARAPCYTTTHQSLCCRDCPVGSHARRLHLRSSCAVVRCNHVKRGRPRTACEQPAKFPTPAF